MQNSFSWGRLAWWTWTLAVACALEAGAAPAFRALVFSKTAAFRHSSIPNGIAAIRLLGTNNNFAVDASEDATLFTDAGLAPYQAVIFLCTTGDILDANQQAAFERYIRAGGGFAGIHSASDTEYSWPWYGQLVGAYFTSHPANQTATVVVADHVHPSSAPLPERWSRFDEWYNFQSNPRGRVHVLATLDERTYAPGAGAMGADHPTAWCHFFDGGRAWYTGGGHTEASYSEPLFLQHLLGGIQWAAGAVAGEAGATVESYFQKVVLDPAPSNPMELAIAPDGRVFYIERGGRLKIYKPDTGAVVIAGQIPVFTQLEDGLLGLALDPGFQTNQWLYFYYSPTGAAPLQRLSRFTMTGDSLNTNSERILLTVGTQRDQCCHSGGSLAFGPDGNLFVSTGDNTNPFDSNGFAPIDERAGRSAWDSQKSSANAADLRGKILRVRPQPDGTYTVPAGNLFPADGSQGRPEIYVMGCRNPFRISVDAATGWLYWGEVGPDANATNALRGPAGQDEWNQARTPGNYGWPYFIGPNYPYRDYDFATSNSFSFFNPAAPVNNSPNNTGPTNLPPARPAWIWYPYGNSAEFPELNGGSGRTAMAGPVYHFAAARPSGRRLPAYFENTLFVYEWSRNYLKEVKLDASGGILKINPFLPSTIFRRPMDLELGPDGRLYLIEWGSNFNGDNADALIARIDYLGTNGSATFIPRGSRWKYLDDGSNQGTAWRAPNFNDAAWAEGPAELGYGDAPVTAINGGPSTNRFLTHYFRHRFTVADAGRFTQFAFNVQRDDGVVAYLNTSELFRMNMPTGAVTFTTLAGAAVGGADESAYFSTNLPASALISGTNVLAVELHQSAPNTSDASFDLEMRATLPVANSGRLDIARTMDSVRLAWSEPWAVLEQASTALGPWSPVTPAAASPFTVTPGAAARFYRLREWR